MVKGRSIMKRKLKKYYSEKFAGVHHIIMPVSDGTSVKIYLIPPKEKKNGNRLLPAALVIGEADAIPVNYSWAVLLSVYIKNVIALVPSGNEDADSAKIYKKSIKTSKRLFGVSKKIIKNDIDSLLGFIDDFACGRKTSIDISAMSLPRFTKYLSSPLRAELRMNEAAPAGCGGCGLMDIPAYESQTELTTKEWEKVIDTCGAAGVPQLIFSTGKPFVRGDLPEIITYASWFNTTMRTDASLLTPELCASLKEAGVDNVEARLFAADADVQNELSGCDDFDACRDGICNAVEAGLNVTVSTPLCLKNYAYPLMIEFLYSLGVKRVTASVMTFAEGYADDEMSNTELFTVLTSAVSVCSLLGIKFSFTSPGFLSGQQYASLGLSTPFCSACSSSTVIASDGSVFPCAGSMNTNFLLGKVPESSLHKIWKTDKCEKISVSAGLKENGCLLRPLVH